jgi:hypothetical protein
MYNNLEARSLYGVLILRQELEAKAIVQGWTIKMLDEELRHLQNAGSFFALDNTVALSIWTIERGGDLVRIYDGFDDLDGAFIAQTSRYPSLIGAAYPDYDAVLKSVKEEYGDYVPGDFSWEDRIVNLMAIVDEG